MKVMTTMAALALAGVVAFASGAMAKMDRMHTSMSPAPGAAESQFSGVVKDVDVAGKMILVKGTGGEYAFDLDRTAGLTKAARCSR